ncbi:O-antigen ligase family protein [Actinoplanes sp. NPDC051851]|uniref:O-antigen ligase family protein n=1 Tax=Actinoplanes sp. NPDC051851 TaxID=3154753 RepID=UPI00343F9FA9
MTVLDPPPAPRPGLVVVLAFITALAGRFVLTRLGLDVAVINDVRVPLFLALLMMLALESHVAGHRRAAGGGAYITILALLGYQALSAAWAPPGAAVEAAVIDLVAIALLLTVYYQLAAWDRDHVTATTLKLFHAAAWVYFLAASTGRGHEANGRWAALGGGPNVFVRVMILGVLTSFYLYLKSGDKLRWLVPIPAFMFGAIASGSRGGLVALFMTVTVAGLAIRPRFNASRASKPLTMLVVLAILVALTAGQTIAGFVQSRFVDATVGQGYTSDRDVLFRMALRLFLQRPLLGTGINGFHVLTDLGVGERYVHNLPLSVAAEGGFTGLVLLGLSWFALWRAYLGTPRPQRSLEARTAAYCGIFIGASSLFSGDYYDARLMWMFLLLSAVRPATPPTPLTAPPTPLTAPPTPLTAPPTPHAPAVTVRSASPPPPARRGSTRSALGGDGQEAAQGGV